MNVTPVEPLTANDADSKDIVLIRDGKPHATIAYSDRSTYKTRLAARRLQNFLARMTGVSLPLESLSDERTTASRVLLGPEAARTAGVNIAQTYPGGERNVVKAVGSDLAGLPGHSARGRSISRRTRLRVYRTRSRLARGAEAR